MFGQSDTATGWRRLTLLCTLFFTVVGLHAAVLGALYFAGPQVQLVSEPPAISGILIDAPPAEKVQAPASAPPQPEEPKPTPPEPEPEPEPEPIPEPEPEPEPLPEPEPEPIPEPEPEPEPEPPVEIEPEQPTPVEPVNEALAELDVETADSEGAPIVAPNSTADHLNNPSPAYPRRSARLGEEGTVLLEVLILVDGSVGDIRLLESSGHDRLDETALEAVRHWRYVPATQNGEPVEFWYQQPITFTLSGSR